MKFVAITPNNRQQCTPWIDEIYRLRHEVFVEELGWPLRSSMGREIDAYDTPQARYIAGISDSGEVVATTRLTPTTGSSLIFDHFADFVDGMVPAGSGAWENSRTAVRADFRGKNDKHDIHARLVCAWHECALRAGVTYLIYVITERLAGSIQRLGITYERLGPTRMIDGEATFVAGNHVNRSQIDSICRRRGLHGPFLTPLEQVIERKTTKGLIS